MKEGSMKVARNDGTHDQGAQALGGARGIGYQ